MSTEDLSRSREGSKEPEVKCPVCAKFEPQAWRKKYCKNCFHTAEEHNDDSETTKHEIEKEMNEKNKDEKSNEKIKEILTKEDKNKQANDKSDKPSNENNNSSVKKDNKTSSLAEKFTKKPDTPQLPSKIGHDKNKYTASKLDAGKKTDESEKSKSENSKLDNDKKSDSSKDTVKKKETSEPKTWGSKSKTSTQDSKTDKNTKETEEKPKQHADKKDTGPKQTDSKLKWNKLWGAPLQNTKKEPEVKDTNSKKDGLTNEANKSPPSNVKSDVKNEKVDVKGKTDVKSDEKTKNGKDTSKNPLFSKFETKDTGSNFDNTKKVDDKTGPKGSTEKKEEKREAEKKNDSLKSKFETKDKTGSKESMEKKEEKREAEKKNDSLKSKFETKDKTGSKENVEKKEEKREAEKKNDTLKSKFETKDSSKPWGEKLKSKTDDKKENEQSKKSATNSLKSKFESKNSDKIEKQPETNGDKHTNKDIKSKSSEKEVKDDNKTKTDNSLSSKSKFETSKTDKDDSKISKKFGVDLKKPGLKESKPPDEKGGKTEPNHVESDNKKNEKLEGKLKLDIKKAEEANKNEQSQTDWRKAKYEKLSKTPTSINPGKLEQKTYSRSKSDTAALNAKLDEQLIKKSGSPSTAVINTKLVEQPQKTESPSKTDKGTNIFSPVQTDKEKNILSPVENTVQTDKGKNILSPVEQPVQEGKEKNALSPVEHTVTDTENNTLSPVEYSVQTDKEKNKNILSPVEYSVQLDKLSDKSNGTAGQEDLDIDDEDEAKVNKTQSVSKLNTDEINKIKEAAKFLLDDDFDDCTYKPDHKVSTSKSLPSRQATSSLVSSANEHEIQGTRVISNSALGKNEVDNVFNEKFNSEAERLRKQLKVMEERCLDLEEENKNLRNGLLEKEQHSGRLTKQKQDVENSIKVMQKNLSSIELKCTKLESENAKLSELTKIMQAKYESSSSDELRMAHLEELNLLKNKLNEGENIEEELREDNECLKQEILDLKNEMEEMYDTFRDQEAEEFREIQREMEMHAKNCRVLSFKLRKYERINDQLEAEKEAYEDKITALQNQISDDDIRSHVRDIEEELRLAKEVSVRLHDELDILEEKKCKIDDENRQLTQILEQSDKKQFRLELEVDKLRDQVNEFKKKMADKSTPGAPQDEVKDRRVLMGRIGQQGSQEKDISQLTRDLFDSMERETDLKDQLQFAEEEIKSLRRQRDGLEEENENLSVQLKKMSASKVTRYMNTKKHDEPEFTETEIDLKLQLDLNEQELKVTKRKVQDLENENDRWLDECKALKIQLVQKDQLLSTPQPPTSPNSYYEDKLKELNCELDELKWKIIEKDREIEKLSAEISQTRQSKLRKSRSLDKDYHENYSERKKHLELDLSSNIDAKDKVIDVRVISPGEHSSCLKQTCFKDSNISPDSGSSVTSSPIQTLVFTRSQIEETKPALISKSFTDQSTLTDECEQVETLQEKVDSLQEKLCQLELENRKLKDSFIPEADEEQGETKEELMDRILDMEEEAEIIQEKLKKKDADIRALNAEVTSLKSRLESKESEFRRKEIDILRELDIAQEKNDVLSNLLDIVKDRADAAEAELERVAADQISQSTSVSSENSARTVSVLSDVSFGSDEVFAGGTSRGSSAPGSPESLGKREKRSVIQKDWEGQFRKRVHCLERILAEERQKLAATEKKLALVSTETLSSAMSDDAKLHEREKEILQNDLLETKKHLRIASDQIHGLKDRIDTLEKENEKLKESLWAVKNESDDDDDYDTASGSVDTVLSAGTPSGSIDTVLSMGSGDELLNTSEDEHSDTKFEKEAAKDVEFFRQRVCSLEARLEEANDVWKTKHSATEKEKQDLENELSKMAELCNQLREASVGFKSREEKALKSNNEYVNTIKEKQNIIARKDEIIQEHEDIIKQREDDMQQLLDQISQRDDDIRELCESIRSRDERLKEKDDILQNMNLGTTEQQEEINFLTNEMSDSASQIKEKDAKIKDLEDQLKTSEDKSKASNIIQENERLKRELEDMAFSIGKLHTDNNTLQNEMEKAKQALSEAMVLWNKDRSTLGQELSIAREKITMYEASFDKKESQAAQLLRKETHKHLEQKEKLQHDIRIMKVEHDANMRTIKNEKLKLQDELTQTIRQLTTEMSNNDKMSADLERLKNQEEVAYQIQHHEKVLRAEYMAMKVRFETRLENLQKEHTKLLTILDQMQHEKSLNQEIIKGVQKQMSNMKANYNKNLDKLKEQNETMECHMKELEGARNLAMELQKKVESLKLQLEDQEYERAELVDRITAERSVWEVERSNKQSKINQLEERLAMINNAQCRTKDMQTRMEVAWNKERAEQKRLLQEAHNLAMDLQQQLKSRDEEHIQEKRVLLEQLRVLRKQLDEEQISHRDFLSKQGTRDEQIVELERRLKEVQDKAEKEHESSMKDQTDLVRRLGEMRRQHKRDQRRMEDVLSGLTRLRELASLVAASENNTEISDNELECRLETLETRGDTGAAAAPETARETENIRQRINDVVLRYIKEALREIHFAAENIAHPREVSDEERRQLRRSLSSSELDALKDDFVLETLTSNDLEASRPQFGPIRPESPIKYHRSISGADVKDDKNLDLPGIHMGSVASRKKNIMSDVHNEQGLKMKFPEPPPSFLLPRCLNTTRTTSTVTRKEMTSSSVRPIPKSISIDTCLLRSIKMTPDKEVTKSSSSCSPLSIDSSQCSLQQNLTPIPVTHTIPAKNQLSASAEIVTPRTARRQFFAESPTEQTAHKPWPTRSRSHESVSRREKESLVGTGISERIMNESSDSREIFDDTFDSTLTDTSTTEDPHEESEEQDQPSQMKESKGDKKKRKAAKRSVSLDSSAVKNTLAKAGVSVMSPAAPSVLSPSELFAAVKRKFRPNVKRSSSLSEKELHSVRGANSQTSVVSSSSSQDMRNTFEPPLSGLPPKSIFIPPPTPPISAMLRKTLPVLPDDRPTRSRDKKPEPKRKQRSKSAERAKTGPGCLQDPLVKQDIIPKSKLLGFETSV